MNSLTEDAGFENPCCRLPTCVHNTKKRVFDQREIPLHCFYHWKPVICADHWFLEPMVKIVQWDFPLINFCPRVQASDVMPDYMERTKLRLDKHYWTLMGSIRKAKSCGCESEQLYVMVGSKSIEEEG
jgi:hypothetical protein